MAQTQRLIVPASLACCILAACSPSEDATQPSASDSGTPSTAELAERLVAAMGGRAALEDIETIVLSGAGTRTRMGQIAETGGEDPLGELANVTETIDLANGRAAFDYDVINGGFMQHRTEVLTTHEGQRVGWATGPGRPTIATSTNGLFSWATQNTPEMLLRRNVISVALAAGDSASASQMVQQRTFNGGSSLYGTVELASGEEVGLYFDPDTGLLDGFVTLDTETMLGDVEAEYILGDYGPVDGLVLPHSMTIRKEGRSYASIEYDSIAVNDQAALEIFAIPADAAEQADVVVAAGGAWAPLAWNEVASGVYHAVGYSHHSMIVEFPSFVAVVEGPYTEAQSLTLARRIEQEINKPIRYVIPTHPHYDHTGGIRGLAAVGAAVLVAEGHEGELRRIVEAPHTNPPDELARREAAGEEVGTVEVFRGATAIEEGERSLELFEVEGIPHVNPKVLAFVPDVGVLFQSDLFFGGPSPDAVALYAAIQERGLAVETIVGGHGGTIPFTALQEAASGNAE